MGDKMETTAMEPFKFCTRLTLTEVTGRKAVNITELLEGIKAADDAIISIIPTVL